MSGTVDKVAMQSWQTCCCRRYSPPLKDGTFGHVSKRPFAAFITVRTLVCGSLAFAAFTLPVCCFGQFRRWAASLPPALPITRARHRRYWHHHHRRRYHHHHHRHHHTLIRTNRSFSMISLITALNRSHSWALQKQNCKPELYLSSPSMPVRILLITNCTLPFLTQLKIRAIVKEKKRDCTFECTATRWYHHRAH